MKREGRQHGMVRSYMILPSPFNPRPNTRFVTRFDYPPTSGLFTKVSSKPTNHSKFTGKCGRPQCVGCHLHPACKSKEKTKGNHKHRNSWRVMDQPDLMFVGLSATRMLDHFSNNDYMEDEVQEEIRDQIDEYGDWVNNNDGKCISEIMFDFQMDHVEEKSQEEDWCLVESCS